MEENKIKTINNMIDFTKLMVAENYHMVRNESEQLEGRSKQDIIQLIINNLFEKEIIEVKCSEEIFVNAELYGMHCDEIYYKGKKRIYKKGEGNNE